MPVLAVVTNIDADHMETYGHDYRAGCARRSSSFLHRMPFYGAAIVCGDDAGVQRDHADAISRPVITLWPRRRRARCARPTSRRCRAARCASLRSAATALSMPTLDITLNLPGVHNVRNALAAIAVATELELPDAPVVKALAEFTGVGRRFQRYGELPARDGGTLHADRRLRPPPGRRWRPCSPRRAARSRPAPGARRSSRTATRARAIASRTSSRCWARPMRCC